MREMPWLLLLGVIMAAMMTLPALAGRLSYDDDSYLTGERGGRDETKNRMYEEVSKRELKKALAPSPDFHRYASRSFLETLAILAKKYFTTDSTPVMEGEGVTRPDRRPDLNPMRFGR